MQGFLPGPPTQRQGPYEAMLMLPPGGLYAGQEMEIEFRVVDVERAGADGAPRALERARIRAEADMPAMPSMPKFDEIAHTEGIPGVFGVHPVFPHGGDYRLCLTILPPELERSGEPARPAVTLEFPLTVRDAASSPTPPANQVRPYGLEVTTRPRHPLAGEEVEIEFAVRMLSSFEDREVTEFDVQHERLMHAFIVRDDLAVFAHEHPELTGPGTFRLRWRFPEPGRYRIFADVAPKDAGSQVLSATVRVGGEPATAPSSAPANDARVDFAWPEGGMPSGRTLTVPATLTDEGGKPIRDIEPWLGAMAHLILVHEDAETFAHAHPDDREPGVGRDGRIPFLVRLPKPGRYKGWMQFQRSGRVETLEMAVEAVP